MENIDRSWFLALPFFVGVSTNLSIYDALKSIFQFSGHPVHRPSSRQQPFIPDTPHT